MEIIENCTVQELLKFDPTKPVLPAAEIILVAIGAVMLNNVIYMVGMKYFMPKDMSKKIDEEYDEDLQDKGVSPLVYGFSEMINSGIYAPIVEELFFRFLFLKMILIKMCKIKFDKANIIHAVIFGGLHMTNAVISDQQINRTIVQSIMAGIGGLIAGYTYKYTNSIFTPLLSHFINNMIAAGHEVIDYAKTYAIIKETFKINF